MRNRIIHGVAGTLILAGLALGILFNSYWFLLSGFVGLNLLQNAFSKWCLLEDILKYLKVEN